MPPHPSPACPSGLRAAALGLALAASWSCSAGEPPRRPDVILVVIDTLRADRMSAYGYERPTTPFLERLAGEGAIFLDVTAQSSWTQPSMVSLFSGRYLTQYRDVPDPEVPTLAETFQRAGYRTLGASANILLDERSGFARGFEYYDSRPLENESKSGAYRARDIDTLLADTEPALQRFSRQPEDGTERPPLLLYLQPFDPHAPYIPRPEWEHVLPSNELEALAELDWQRALFAAQGPDGPPEDPEWTRQWESIRLMRAFYDQGVRHTDEVLARAFEEWRAKGLLDHAVIAIASDHGEGLWEHPSLLRPEERAQAPPKDFFYMDHGAHLYREGVFTPLILWGAGVPAGARIATPVENVDLFPTLLELCDVPLLAEVHGTSLVPLMRGRELPPRDAVFSFVLHSRSVRELDTDMKLIQPSSFGRARRGTEVELYALAADPLERTDLADARPMEVERLVARLEEWREAHPTRTSLGAGLDEERLRMLRDLGYTGEIVGVELSGEN